MGLTEKKLESADQPRSEEQLHLRIEALDPSAATVIVLSDEGIVAGRVIGGHGLSLLARRKTQRLDYRY